MSALLKTRFFLSHWLNAVDDHSLHSPFFYDFYRNVIKKRVPFSRYQHIEYHRKGLLNNRSTINVEDLGAGSVHFKSPVRRICDITKVSVSPQKLSILYHKLIQYANARTILELGTSVGINTLYLAEEKNATVYTFEGSASIAGIARVVFEAANAPNIQMVEGDISKTLPAFLGRSRGFRPDLVIIDANHRYASTLQYFNQLLPFLYSKSIVVIDDIHHSTQMKKAWDEIRQHKLVYGSADLFRCGIVFFDVSLNRQHVVLQY